MAQENRKRTVFSPSGFLSVYLPSAYRLIFFSLPHSLIRNSSSFFPKPDDIKTQDQTQNGDEKEKGQAEDDIVFKK
jgi:hypothetical protein